MAATAVDVRHAISIGGVAVSFECDGRVPPWTLDSGHRDFTRSGESVEVRLRLHLGPLPSLRKHSPRYGKGRLWAVREVPAGFLVATRGPVGCTTRLAFVDSGWSAGDLFVRADDRFSGCGRYPLEFPFETVFFPAVLAHHRGLVVHAAGAVIDGRGLLFAGRSRAGKTTIARLFRARGIEVLSDERIVVRIEQGRPLMYGTPWHGDLGVSSPRSLDLDTVFFLERGTATRAIPVSIEAAARQLAPRCRLPFWDPTGMDTLLDTVADMAAHVPAFDLPFVPDPSVAETIARVVA